MEDQLQATPICDRHRALNALMAPFGGWDMPIQYEGIIAEHGWCRNQSALFDICHMGEFIFEGDFEAGGLEDVFTFSVKTIPIGRSRYGFLLNEQGGIIDDLIVFRLAEDKVMIVVNAATAPKDFAAIKGRLRGGSFTDITAATGKLDLQGPLSRYVMVELFGEEVATIPYFKFITMNILGVEAIVSRTGYTGELGYEIFIPSKRSANCGICFCRMNASNRPDWARGMYCGLRSAIRSTAAILTRKPRRLRRGWKVLSTSTSPLSARMRCCG